MMYTSAVEQIKGAKTAAGSSEMLLPVLRLAEVTSLSSGRAYVKFYGETSASSKLYPYIEGYKPTVGDKVLMLQQGSTLIIAGKISKDNVVDNYYLLKSVADTLYLTQAAADARYEPIGGGDQYIYTLRRQANSWYFQLGTDGSLYGNNQSGSLQFVSIGNSSNPMKHVYTQGMTIKDSGSIVPAVKNASDIGSQSYLFNYGYFNNLGGANINYAIQKLNVRDATIYGTSITVNTNNSVNVGASGKQLNNVYAKQFYQNGTAISTSDRRKKTGIKGIGKKYIDFFRKLRPKLFKFKDGDSGRLHSGFIAQDVEEAAVDCGIDSKDLAFLCIDEEGNYGLRYDELIAIQTKVIQDLLGKVETLESRVEALEEIIKGGR